MSDEDQAMPSEEAVTDDIDILAEEVTQTVTDADAEEIVDEDVEEVEEEGESAKG